jgi:glycosyltransferase involved in cell wall biosynthesis
MIKTLIWQYTNLNLNNVGGVETHIIQTSKALEKIGFSVKMGRHSISPIEFSNYDKIFIQTHGDLWFNYDLLKQKFNSLTKRKNIFNIHIAHGNTLERMNACNEWKSISGWKGAIRDYSAIMMSNAVIGVSDHAISELKKYYPYFGKTKVIRNGVDQEIFQPLHNLSDKPRVLFLGRYWDRVKNLKSLLKVSRKIHREYPDFQLWVAPDYDSTEPFVHDLEKLNPTKLNEAFQQVRALIIPSYYEGDPLVAREAMAVGIPIIASNIPGILETCKDYPLLFTFDLKNLDQLKSQIENVLYKNQSLIPTSRVRSWDETAKEFSNFYQEF